MPFNETDMEDFSLGTSSFGYSGVSLDSLDDVGTRFTLVHAVADVSPSTRAFLMDIEACLAAAAGACKMSPERDTFMLRVTKFSSQMAEVHGFKPLGQVEPGDYAGSLGNKPGHRSLGALTALYDASVNAVESIRAESTRLAQADFDVNACLIVITDGDDNHSSLSAGDVRREIERLQKEEACESILPILVGVNIMDPSISRFLKGFKDQGGFAQYVELGSADKQTLAKLANFIAKSASAQSQSLGTGGPSKPLDINDI